MTVLRFLTASALCLVAVSGTAQDHAGQYDAADIEFGAQLFGERCVACHGQQGDALPQANLRDGQFRHSSNDRGLARTIRQGVPGTAMVANGYSDSQIAALVAYLRNITRYEASAGGVTLGDAERGEALFTGRGDCLSCHRVGASGPRFAPALTDIGTKRTASKLRATLVNPSEALLPINRPVTARLRDGRQITGRRLNEDTFTLQLITANEELLSIEKSALASYQLADESLMPAYGEIFNDDEIADLLAYLLSLRGLR